MQIQMKYQIYIYLSYETLLLQNILILFFLYIFFEIFEINQIVFFSLSLNNIAQTMNDVLLPS